MRIFLNLLKKEIKDLLTKELILSLVFTVAFFTMMGSIFKSSFKEIKKEKIKIALLDKDKTPLSQKLFHYLSSFKEISLLKIEKESTLSAIKKARKKGVKILVLIPQGFEKNFKKNGETSIEIISNLEKELLSPKALGPYIKIQTILKGFFPKKDPLLIKEFLASKEKILPGSPQILQATFSFLSFLPVVLIMTIIFCGSLIINSLAQEKEQKTLETLFSLPIKKETLILAKIAGASLVALLSSFVLIGGFNFYFSSLSPEKFQKEKNLPSKLLEALNLKMGPLEYIILGLSLFLTIFITLEISLILGIFAQDTKSAQILNLPLSFFAFLPYFVLTFLGMENLNIFLKILILILPFSHPVVALEYLPFHEIKTPFLGIIYLLFLSILIFLFLLKIFESERILTTSFNFRKFKFFRRKL